MANRPGPRPRLIRRRELTQLAREAAKLQLAHDRRVARDAAEIFRDEARHARMLRRLQAKMQQYTQEVQQGGFYLYPGSDERRQANDALLLARLREVRILRDDPELHPNRPYVLGVEMPDDWELFAVLRT